MTTTVINEIRHKMNIYGREARPFFFAINFEQTEGLFIDNPLQQTDVLFQFCGKGNAPEQEVIKKVSSFNYIPIPYSEYKKKFDIVHKGLKEGYSYLTNLTIKTPVSFNLTLEDIFFLIIDHSKFVNTTALIIGASSCSSLFANSSSVVSTIDRSFFNPFDQNNWRLPLNA